MCVLVFAFMVGFLSVILCALLFVQVSVLVSMDIA